jgi:hypothetical protein
MCKSEEEQLARSAGLGTVTGQGRDASRRRAQYTASEMLPFSSVLTSGQIS